MNKLDIVFNVTDKQVTQFSRDIKLLITYPSYVFQPIVDVATALYNSFLDMNVDVMLQPMPDLNALNNAAMSNSYSHIISVNSHDYLEREHKFFMDKPRVTKLISYNLEQTPIDGQNSAWATMRLSELGQYGMYFDYIATESSCKMTDVKNLGLRTLHLDLPYHPCLDLNIEPNINDKQYDVIFIGCGSGRRQALLDQLTKEGLKIAPTPMPIACQKEFKSNMVNRSKICLNVHYSDMEYFEKPRIMYDYMMNKGVIVSEKIMFPEKFKHIENIFMSKYVNLVPMIIMAVKQFNEKTMLTGLNTYNLFKTEYAYEKVITNFLRELLIKETMFQRRF